MPVTARYNIQHNPAPAQTGRIANKFKLAYSNSQRGISLEKEPKYGYKKCEYCGREFAVNRRNKRYCRDTCQKIASKKRQSNWKDVKRTYQREYAYRKHKGSYCECCGFIPKHPCQLDVHHVDQNRKNNSIENLMTLCANCHRLVHFSN